MNLFIAVLLTLTLTGCASARHRTATPEVHEVVYLPDTAARTAAAPVATSFAWPVKGAVIAAFGDRSGDFRNKGIDIAAPEGTIVRAAGDGRVVYCDSMMRGFGKTVILDHGNAIQTVYSYNAEILTQPGSVVRKSDPIAKVGSTGRARTASLHFEVRRDGEPVDPLRYLR